MNQINILTQDMKATQSCSGKESYTTLKIIV